MKNKIILTLIMLMAFTVLAVPGSAEQCLTFVDGTTPITTNVTVGTNVQIAVTPSGSCANGEISLSLAYSNCTLIVSEPVSQEYLPVSSGVVRTFSVTSGSAGVCVVTARGTTSDGIVEDNTPIVLDFVDASALSVEGGPSAVTVSSHNNFTLTVNISNPQNADLLTSFLLTTPSGLDRIDGDGVGGTRIIYAGGVKSLSWIIKHTSCFTGTKTITFQLGDNPNAFAAVVTGNSSCSSSGSGSNSSGTGESGGLGGNGTSAPKEVKVFSGAAGSKQTFVFTTITSPGITAIELTLSKSVVSGNLSLSVGSKPSGAGDAINSLSGKLYSYSEISLNNSLNSDYSSIKIKFKVSTTWMTANKIDHQKVYMYRWNNNAWNMLPTTFKSNDTNNFFYEAETPGFSTFVIGGYKNESDVVFTNSSGVSISVISPTVGMIVTGTTLNVQLSAAGITLAVPQGNAVSGEAHFHVWIDGEKEQSGSGTSFLFTNISPGNHTLKVELMTGNYSSLDPPVVMTIPFTVSPIITGAASSSQADYFWGFIIVIVLVVATAIYFFKYKHLTMKSAKYFAHKSAEKVKDFTPKHISEALAREAKALSAMKPTVIKEFMSGASKTIKSFKVSNFAPKNIEKFMAKEANAVGNSVAQAEGPQKKKDDEEGSYSFAS